MFSKLISWIKGLVFPVKIDEEALNSYIEYIHRVTAEEKHNLPQRKVSSQKPLNDKLKGVELPLYARDKKLPPKAKRKFIESYKKHKGLS